MPQTELKRRRLKKGETKSIRADASAFTKFKDGQAAAVISEAGRGIVIVMLPDDLHQRGDLALSILQAIRQAAIPIESGGEEARVELTARLIAIDRLRLLDPMELDAPVGHAVLEMYVGGVPLRFTAPAEWWEAALKEAPKATITSRSLQ